MGRSWIVVVVALLCLAQKTEGGVMDNDEDLELADQAFEVGNTETEGACLQAALAAPNREEISANIVGSTIKSLVGKNCTISLDVKYPNSTTLHEELVNGQTPPLDIDGTNWNNLCIVSGEQRPSVFYFEGNMMSPKYGRGYWKQDVIVEDGKAQHAYILIDFTPKAKDGCPRNKVQVLKKLFEYIATGNENILDLIFTQSTQTRTVLAQKHFGDTIIVHRSVNEFKERMREIIAKLRAPLSSMERLSLRPTFTSWKDESFSFTATHHINNDDTESVGVTNGQGEMEVVDGRLKITSLTLMITSF